MIRGYIVFICLSANMLILPITFDWLVIWLSYFMCAFHVTRSFILYQDFFLLQDLDLGVWPTLTNFNLCHIFWLVSDRAFIFRMCIPCNIKTFLFFFQQILMNVFNVHANMTECVLIRCLRLCANVGPLGWEKFAI